MNTAPTVAVTLVAAPDGVCPDDVAAAIAAAGVSFGARSEVDLDVLGRDFGDLAREVGAYMRTYRRFAQAAVEGRRTGPYVAIERPLARFKENGGNNGGRVELAEQYHALVAVSEIAEAVDALLDKSPDFDVVAAAAERLEVDDVEATAVFRVASFGAEWPAELGGARWPTELSRTFAVRARYAAGRTRRIRRLAAVEVRSLEMWPDPAEFAAAARSGC